MADRSQSRSVIVRVKGSPPDIKHRIRIDAKEVEGVVVAKAFRVAPSTEPADLQDVAQLNGTVGCSSFKEAFDEAFRWIEIQFAAPHLIVEKMGDGWGD